MVSFPRLNFYLNNSLMLGKNSLLIKKYIYPIKKTKLAKVHLRKYQLFIRHYLAIKIAPIFWWIWLERALICWTFCKFHNLCIAYVYEIIKYMKYWKYGMLSSKAQPSSKQQGSNLGEGAFLFWWKNPMKSVLKNFNVEYIALLYIGFQNYCRCFEIFSTGN